MPDTIPAAVLAAAQRLKDRHVRVTIGPTLVITGRLVDVTEDGGAEVELDGGGTWHAWPVLAIEEAGSD